MQRFAIRWTVSGCAIFAAVLLVAAPASPARSSSSQLSALASTVFAQLNAIRIAHGLVPLKLNSGLSSAAEQHSSEMLNDGYFAHNSADGSAFWQRIARRYPSTQYRYWSVGENLLWSGESVDATTALNLWLASPEHRANILDPEWREIGVAALYEADAPGAFGGYTATLVTTDFGVRR